MLTVVNDYLYDVDILRSVGKTESVEHCTKLIYLDNYGRFIIKECNNRKIPFSYCKFNYVSYM